MNNTATETSASQTLTVTAVIAGVNAVVSMGFAIATIAAESSATSWYAADRAAALLTALIVVVARRDRGGLLVVGWMLAGVQAADAVVGIAAGDISKVIGPAVLAIATALALSRHAR